MERQCKTCGRTFYLSNDEEHYFTRQPIGDTPMQLPARCEECRTKHKERIRLLARSNFNIPNSRGGNGCFEELTQSDLSEIEQWASFSEETTHQPPAEKIQDKQREMTFTLLSPTWIHRPVSETKSFHYPWGSIAQPFHSDHPETIKFSVENRLTGVAWLRDLPKGLALWWLEYAPWASKYQRANLSLLFYAIAKSIHQGTGGQLFARPIARFASLFKSTGFLPEDETGLLVLSSENSLRLVLVEHQVPESIIELLFQKNQNDQADIHWIAEQVGRGHLTPRLIEAFTRMSHTHTWNDLKTISNQGKFLPIEKRRPLILELGHILAAMAARNIFQRQGGQVENGPGGSAAWQTVRFLKPTRISGFRKLEQETIVKYTLSLGKNHSVVLVTRAWRKDDFGTGEMEATCQLFQEIGDRSAVRILAVTQDFNQIHILQKQSLLRQLDMVGANLWVIYPYTPAIHDEVKHLLRRLALPATIG